MNEVDNKTVEGDTNTSIPLISELKDSSELITKDFDSKKRSRKAPERFDFGTNVNSSRAKKPKCDTPKIQNFFPSTKKTIVDHAAVSSNGTPTKQTKVFSRSGFI